MTTTTHNGRERKSLAEQIDRLDGLLDGLSQGITDTVVAAVQEAVGVAVQQAVQAVLSEFLNNQDLLRILRGPLAFPAPPTAPPIPEPAGPRPTGLLSRVGAWARRLWGRACQTSAVVLGVAGRGLAAGWQLLLRFRGPVLLAVGVGAAAGMAAYLCGPWLAAGAAWVGGFATTLAVQAGMTWRRALAALSFPGA